MEQHPHRLNRILIVATFGLYALIAWLLNAANDAYVLLFYSDPHLLTATIELWTNMTGYLILAIFLVFFITCMHLQIEDSSISKQNAIKLFLAS